jgi:hypothetical protein
MDNDVTAKTCIKVMGGLDASSEKSIVPQCH